MGQRRRRRIRMDGIMCILVGSTAALSLAVDTSNLCLSPLGMGSLGLIIRVPAITNLMDITISGLPVGGMAGGTMELAPTRLTEATNPGLLETGLILVEITTVLLVEITTTPTIFLVKIITSISAEITVGANPGEAGNITSGRNSSLSYLTETNLVDCDIIMVFCISNTASYSIKIDRRLVRPGGQLDLTSLNSSYC
jgi:hypothetical protein